MRFLFEGTGGFSDWPRGPEILYFFTKILSKIKSIYIVSSVPATRSLIFCVQSASGKGELIKGIFSTDRFIFCVSAEDSRAIVI